MRIEISRKRGSVLLEVVLAVVLFAAAATVIGVGLKASMDSSERLRMSAHAGNLAITVASELQMGMRSLADTGPEAFGPPFEGWVWEIAAVPWNETEGTANNLVQVEVIVRHEPTGFAHRFAEVMQLDASITADGSMNSWTPPAGRTP
jgi:type II secretory pathway pseudopilin PulG